MIIRASGNRERRTVPARELRVSTADDGTTTVSGIAIVYNSLSYDLGGFKELVSPGALTNTLQANPDVLCLRDHDAPLLLGRTKSGTLQLTDTPAGLSFTCQLPNTAAGRDLAESLKRGDIDACSFGFSVISDTWTTNQAGDDIRTLLEIELYEVSIVSFPAYGATTAALRNCPVEIRSRIESRSLDTPTCPCPCPQCESGDCNLCSDPDCNYDDCTCPDDDDMDGMDEEDSLRSWRELSEQRMRLLTATNL